MLPDAVNAMIDIGKAIAINSLSIDPDDVPLQNMKVVICGDEKTGKTKIVGRLVNDSYNDQYFQTIGSDIQVCHRIVPGANVRMEIWDTAGNMQHRSILPMFFTNADIVIVTYDVTNRATFDSVIGFVSDARRWVGAECDVAIFGTKIDSWKVPRQVTVDEALALAQKLNARYFETSSVTTQGLEDAIRKMLKRTLKRKRLLPDWLMSSPREGLEDED